MREIEIYSGFAQDVFNNGAGVSFKLGSPPIALALWRIPRRNALNALAPPPIAPNEWLAVAVRRSNFSGSGYVLLALRRLGLRGDAEAANATLAAWLLALGIAGAAASSLADSAAQVFSYATCFLLLIALCVFRIFSVRRATRLLQAWKDPSELT